MVDDTLEPFPTWKLGPLRLGEEPCGVADKVCNILKLLPRLEVLRLDVPLALVIVPFRTNDLVLQLEFGQPSPLVGSGRLTHLDLVANFVLVNNVGNILTNLRLRGVEAAPLSVLGKRVLVGVGGKITRGAHVAVVVPCKVVSFTLSEGVR